MLRKSVLVLAVSLASMLIFVACDSGNNISGSSANFQAEYWPFPVAPTAGEPSEWSLLIYVAADNELQADANRLVSTLQSCNVSQGNLKVFAIIDELSIPGAQLLENTTGAWELSSDDEEVNMADPAILRNFVQYAEIMNPGAKTVLVIKSPGYAWRGVCYDETNDGAVMRVHDLAGALDGAGVDLLIFDASYMGHMDVAYELRSVAPYMVATQSTTTSGGIPYEFLVETLGDNPDMSSGDAAEQLVTRYTEIYWEDFSTIAAYNLAAMSAVGDAYCQIAEVLRDKMRDNREIIAPARDHSEIGLNDAIQQSEYHHDVWVFFSDLEQINNTELSSAIGELKSAFGQLVVAEGHSFRYRDVPHGISFWFPPSMRKYYCDEVTYDGQFIYEDCQLDLVAASVWVDCLFNYYRTAKSTGVKYRNKRTKPSER